MKIRYRCGRCYFTDTRDHEAPAASVPSVPSVPSVKDTECAIVVARFECFELVAVDQRARFRAKGNDEPSHVSSLLSYARASASLPRFLAPDA